MGDNKHSKSFEIALSGIACAIAVVCLLVGYFSGVLLATGYLFAVISLMLPLSRQFFKGAFLAYAGTVILTIVMGAAARFWDLVPFIMFFGLHPLANALQGRFNINKWIALAVKTVWFDCTLIAGYFLIYVVGGASLPPFLEEILFGWRLYVVVFTVGSVLFFPYDYLVFKTQITVDKLVYRIKK